MSLPGLCPAGWAQGVHSSPTGSWQPPTAVKTFSPIHRSEPTRSPTRDVAPICWGSLGGGDTRTAPVHPQPPRPCVSPARAAPALLSTEQSKGSPLIFVKPLIRRLGSHRDGGDVAAGGDITADPLALPLGGAAGSRQGQLPSPPRPGDRGLWSSVAGGDPAFRWHLLPQPGGSSCLAAQHGGNCCKAKAGWAGAGGGPKAAGSPGLLVCCPREIAGVHPGAHPVPCPQRQQQHPPACMASPHGCSPSQQGEVPAQAPTHEVGGSPAARGLGWSSNSSCSKPLLPESPGPPPSTHGAEQPL